MTAGHLKWQTCPSAVATVPVVISAIGIGTGQCVCEVAYAWVRGMIGQEAHSCMPVYVYALAVQAGMCLLVDIGIHAGQAPWVARMPG